MFQFKLVSMFT